MPCLLPNQEYRRHNQLPNRPSAPVSYTHLKLVPEILENVTTPEQYELLEMSRISGFVDRARGTGRPTKKDRRSMEAVSYTHLDVYKRQPLKRPVLF